MHLRTYFFNLHLNIVLRVGFLWLCDWGLIFVFVRVDDVSAYLVGVGGTVIFQDIQHLLENLRYCAL